ncbi:MAG TPA: hypothetical protein VF669_11820 [Tepidisphaeraceae bacterium]|jgi:hypothetical protein
MRQAKVLSLEERRAETAKVIHRLGGSVTARALARHIWRFRRVHAAEALLGSMASAGMGSWINRKAGPKGGRPSKVFLLNQHIGDTAENMEARDDE